MTPCQTPLTSFNLMYKYRLIRISVILLSLCTLTVSKPVNVALNKPVTAYYTCGIFGGEIFNTLSEAYTAPSQVSRHACADLRSANVSIRQSPVIKPTFPPEAMVDGNLTTSWQSVSRSRAYMYGKEIILEIFRELEAIIDIDLLQEFLAEEISIQLGDALSPQKVSIFKSLDGAIFTPWIYAVSNLLLCSQFFNVTIKSVPAVMTDTICIGYTADDIPPGDMISTNLSQVPMTLKEWQRVRYLKIKFFDMLFVYPYNMLAHSFNHYSVLEMTIMAECPCNGLQVGCDISTTTGMYECICGGNTTGRFCESCLPLFNQFPFQFGKTCTACNCFEHATSCFYQASVEEGGLSLNKNGSRSGGGVCTDCQHNTSGINCEKCVRMYYRPADQLQTAVNACVPCQCNDSGSSVNPVSGLMDCVMNNDQPSNDSKVPGDCFCKTNVMGSKCTECKSGFYNLQQANPDGCTSCACHTPGTVNASETCNKNVTGQCNCKLNVQGRACDQCKDGFYGLSNDSINGCLACDCDVGGALNQICGKEAGQCLCQNENIVGRRCDTVRANFYYLSPHGINSELENSFGIVSWKRDPQYSGFSGGGYAVVKAQSSLTALLTVPANTDFSSNYSLIVRYRSSDTTNVTIQLPSADTTSPSMLLLPACPNTWCEEHTSTIDPVTLQSGPNLINLTVNTGEALLDKLVAVPIEFLQTGSVLPNNLPAGCDLLKNTLPSDPTDAATCMRAIFSLTMFYLKAPLPCNCDIKGSINIHCNVSGGQCECQPGIIGRTCNKCSPDHYSFSYSGCSACNCDDYGTICDSVTGQCQCPDNTMGQHCELCVPNNWGWNKTLGCKPCDCDSSGSVSQHCNGTTGNCTCKTGVEGSKCDKCMDEFYNMSSQGCSPCLCNEAGSLGNVCNKTIGKCFCKENTGGQHCDVCLLGTFGLDSKNPKGCLDCICMGITKECVSAGVKHTSNLYQLSRKTNTGVVPTLNLVTENGSIANVSVRFDPNADMTTAAVIDLTFADPRLYWQLPDVLLTSLLSIYRTDILFTVNYVIVDGKPLTDHKALLIDKSGSAMMYPLVNVTQGSDSSLIVSLREDLWHTVPNGSIVTRAAYLKALSTSTYLLLPASFATGNYTSRLSKLEFSTESDVGPVSSAVEQCSCGAGYTGKSCQMCDPSYRRENASSSDFLGVCVSCMCHGHATICDADTGFCKDCLNNTTGNTCENCLTGFYGNATIGTAADCTKCPCYLPGVINNTCENDNTSTNIICPFCQSGYIGIHCNECDLLYYGSPQAINGTCQLCNCHGNAASCDSITGICSNCSFNTTGNNCERCVSGFYGNASLQNCQECQCISKASNTTTCDFITGQCPCMYGVGGRSCDQCLMGFWGYDKPDFTGCKPCGCVEAGSLSVQCDNTTGMCSCKTNTAGSLCDICVDGFFGLPTASCQACMCDTIGSVNTTSCNITSGQCQCKPGIGGRRCDQCLPFFVNMSDTGCQECGLCQKSLGENVKNQSKIATELLNKTLTVVGVQMEDTRLQNLSLRINQSLNSLGLAGSRSTSVNDIIDNVTSIQANLVLNFEITKAKAASLATAVLDTTNNGTLEVARQLEMAERSGNLSKEVNEFEPSINFYVLYLTSYNNTASQYLNRTAGTSNNSFTFETERSAVALLLSQAENTSSINTTNAMIYQQVSDIASLNNTISVLSSNIDGVTASLDNLTSVFATQSSSAASVSSTLTQATVFKSQAEDLRNAVLIILNNTESKYTLSLADLSAARAAAKNTNAVYSGEATTVMTWTKGSFTSDVYNFETGIAKLSNLQTLVPVLIDKAVTTVNQSEAYADYLEKLFANLSSVYQSIPSTGKDAAETIENFAKVVSDLDTAVANIALANQLISQVQGNITGDGFNKLQQEYAAERATSDAMRQELMALDYFPQVLQISLDSATARLDNENSQWAPADIELNAMRAAAQALNSLITASPLNVQIATAISLVEQAQTIAKTVNTSTARQDDVLIQKQAELELLQGQITQIQQLEKNVSQLLIYQQTKYEALQKNLTSAKNQSQTSIDKTKVVADKTLSIQSKLVMAEGLLEKLRQPVNFDGGLGLELKNPVASLAHLYDDFLIEMRRPDNFTDGVIFFVDNPATSAELEVGLLTGKIFFEFNTGFQSVRVTSPAEICGGCWARIYASRYDRVGHLTVIQMSSGGLVSNSERGLDDINAKTLVLSSNLFLGSLPTTQQTTKVANRMFRGCLFNAKYQGQRLNLWASTMSSSQTSKCCLTPPALSAKPTTQGTSFTGFGYLVLLPGSLQFSQSRQLSLEFRTFSAEASLLRVISTDNKTYTSLSLAAGYVVWETLSGGILSRLESQYQYATGQWVQILAEINKTELTLSVKYIYDANITSARNVSLQFLDLSPLDNQNIIIGSSTNPLQTGYTVSNTNFAGCMRNVIVATSTITRQMNFTENVVTSSGVVMNGCYENILYGLGFTSGSAFATLMSIEQMQEIRNLEFDIVTNEPNGILVYISAPGTLRFLYLALFGGNVIVVYRQNNTGVVISSNQYVSDGQIHTVKLDCLTLRVSLRVDSGIFEETSQTLSATYLALSSSAVLQVGGVSNGTELLPECPVNQSYIGGITRLSVNNRVVSFTQSNILFEKDVTLSGIPALSGTTPPPPITTDPPLLPCAVAPIPLMLDLTMGFFMDGTNSINWSQLISQINLAEYFERSFVMNVDIAAFKADGVLLYVADILENPSYYFTIYLLDGYLHLRIKTDLKKEYDIQLSKRYNNGQRIQVEAMKINDFSTLLVNSEKDYINTQADATVQSHFAIPASASVYFGGLGLNVLSLSALPQPFKIQPSKVNFAGAIYSIGLKSQDSQPSNISFQISLLNRTAYPAIPKTAYYGVSLSGNNSYLALGLVNTTENFTTEIKFTTTSESGLFFLWDRATSARYLAMDMNLQQLRLHLYPSYTGVTEPLMIVLYRSASLCDGLQHTVKLEIIGSAATVTVDAKTGTSYFIPKSHSVQALYDAEFYIGGYGGISRSLPSNLTKTSLAGCVLAVTLTSGYQKTVKVFDPTQFVSSSVGAHYGCPY